jgi:hypothetical protein
MWKGHAVANLVIVKGGALCGSLAQSYLAAD